MIRAVIDTNVVVSGLLSPRGNEALIILAIHHGFLRPCVSAAMLEEYADVLARPRFGFPPNAIAVTPHLHPGAAAGSALEGSDTLSLIYTMVNAYEVGLAPPHRQAGVRHFRRIPRGRACDDVRGCEDPHR